jgi:hypothetical protein
MARKSGKNKRSKPRQQKGRPKKAARRNQRRAGVNRKRAMSRRRTAKPKKSARKPARRIAKPRSKVRKSPKSKPSNPKKSRAVASPRLPKTARPRMTDRPALDRSRRVLPDDERLEIGRAASKSDAGQDRMMSAARTGHDELRNELNRHTESSPVLTAGDVDARWQDAYAVGDEAPGGDNPTPDQDRVDDIGKALGIQYQDDQELQGGDEVAERDKHRWELDPASSDDWPHEK